MRPPLEEAEAAGAIKDAGAQAWVLDGPARRLKGERFLAAAESYAADLFIVVTTFGTLAADMLWAKQLKKRFPNVPIGVRGAPCYEGAERILETNPAVDFCVRGEYEIIFNHIVQYGFRESRGVVFRKSGEVVSTPPASLVTDLDSLPWPDRDAIDQKLYSVRLLRRPQATIRVQRGCPFPCTYCLVGSVSGKTARHRSPESVAQEMAYVMRTGIEHFYLRAETFTLDNKWARETATAISKIAPGARWVTTTRAELLDAETAEALQKGGCYGLSFGIDAGSEETARRTKKPINFEAAQGAFRHCDKNRIISLAYLMIGFEWESARTLEETALLAKKISSDLLTIHFAHPYPGTAYHAELEQTRKIISLRAQAEPALEPGQVSARELRRSARRMLMRHYLKPRVYRSLARKLARI